ncbi:MAG: restriction endonuclease subunit S [Methylotenera sp.]|nr:restriction endonuclease subunit S [Methylotenera sp.]MDP3095608.1 restriction endonuclease subunit S [Methylotenera sp.]
MKLKPYPKYKDSGVEWLGPVPNEWTVTKIKHVTSFTTGWTPPTGDSASFEGDNLWANISDLGPKILNDTSKRVSDEAIRRSNITISPRGSLLFSFKLSIGQVGIAGCDLYTNEAIATFLPDNEARLDYLFYASPVFIVQNTSFNIYGAKLLNQELINAAPIALPNQDGQRQIASFLDRETGKLDTLIAKQEKLIELLQEKRQAVISHAVTKGINPDAKMKDSGVEWLGMVPEGWEVKQVKRNFRLLTEKTDRRVHAIALENIESWSGRFIETETIFEGEGIAFNVGDILFGKLRPYLAKAYLTESSGEAVGDFHVLRPASGVAGKYAQYQILSHEFISIIDSSTYGAKMPRASWDFMGCMPFATPSPTEQSSIASFLDRETAKLELLIEKSRRSIELAKEHRTALISAAVTGKIDVREYSI